MSRPMTIALVAVGAFLVLGLVILPLLTLQVTLEMPGEKPRVLVGPGR